MPAHVPAHLVRDFDIYDFEGVSEDVHKAWRRVVDAEPEVFYTTRYGGYWVVTNPEMLEAIWPDGHVYSSAQGTGVPRPLPDSPPLLPIERDDPLHKTMRKPLEVALSPSQVRQLSVKARERCIAIIEELKPRGECDFISDFSLKMPMELFLTLVDLPWEDREWLVDLSSTSLRTPDPDIRREKLEAMIGYLQKWIAEREVNPGNDLMSAIITMDVDGRPLTGPEKLGYMINTMFGGLDTVGGEMGFIAWHLAQHPEHRKFLRENPSAIPAAVEEFFRRFGLPTISRTLTEDRMLGDVAALAGDRVIISTIVHGINEKRWPNALEVDLQRSPQNHLAFGRGTHRCPGANLARAEIRIFIEEWLARIPEFSIAPGKKVVHASGAVAGLKNLPLVWPVG